MRIIEYGKKYRSMKKFILQIILFVLVVADLHAQQLPTFTRYHENLTFINPGALYIDNMFDKYSLYLGATYRYQWVGLKDAPTTQVVRFDNRLNDYDKSFDWCLCNAGLTLINDQTGPTGFMGIYGRFAYIADMTGRSGGKYLSIGINAGMVQYRVKTSSLSFNTGGDPTQGENSKSVYYPDFGGGVFFYSELSSNQGFFVGVSVPQTLGLNLTFRTDDGSFGMKRTQHFYGLVGGNFGLDVLKFRPTIWAKYLPNAPFNLDANLIMQYNKQAWLGFGFATSQVAHLEFGIIPVNLLNGGNENNGELKIGFSFSYPFQNYGPAFGPIGEVNVTYMLDNSD